MSIEANNAASPRPAQVQATPSVSSAKGESAVTQDNTSLQQATAAQQEAQQAQPSLAETVSKINDYAQNLQRNIHFSVSEDTGHTVIEVYDSQTEELIRKIPSEDAQRISKAIQEQMNSGVLLKVNI